MLTGLGVYYCKSVSALCMTFSANAAAIRTADFSPDGKLLAVGTAEGKIHVWGLTENGGSFVLDGGNKMISSLKFSANGKWIAAVGSNGILRIWNVSEKQVVHTIHSDHSEFTSSVAFPANDNAVATGGNDAVIRLWDTFTGNLIAESNKMSDAILSINFSPDGTTITCRTEDGLLSVWDVNRKVKLNDIDFGNAPRSHHYQVLMTKDGKTVLANTFDRSLYLADISAGSISSRISTGVKLGIINMAVSPDGKIVVLSCINSTMGLGDTTLMAFDLKTGKLLKSFRMGRINAVAISADGLQLATGGDNGVVKVWKLQRLLDSRDE